MTSQLWWFAARAGGFVAWGLLSASVIWGLLLSNKLRPGKVRPNWILDLHRFLGGLAVVFTVVHVLTIMADSYTSFGLGDVLVPFASAWKPLPVAWGIVSLYIIAAVEVTSLLKRHLPTTLWRRVHVLSLPLFATATIHLLTAGTDASNRVVTWLVIAVSATVVALTAWRLAHLPGRSGASPVPGRPAPRAGSPRPARAAADTPVTATASARTTDRAAMIRAAREAATATPPPTTVPAQQWYAPAPASPAPAPRSPAPGLPAEPPYYDGPLPTGAGAWPPAR